MRVAYVVEDLGLAGGVRVIVEHAEALAARGHDVVLVTRGDPGWIRVPVPVLTVPEFTRETLPEADILVATFYTTVAPAVRAGRARRVVHFCQGYEAPHPHLHAELGRIHEAYSFPVPKIVVSRHLVDLLAPLYPGPWFAIPQAIQAGAFAPDGPGRTSPRTPPAIGVVGPFEAVMKGIPAALGAVALLRGEGRSVVLHRASQLPLSEAEQVLCKPDSYECGRPAREMPAWYAGLDLLIHPSFPAEGFPLPPLEAMASGVPVVLTDIPSFAPIPDDVVSRVPPGDAEAMARAAARLLDEPALWAERREKGLALANAYTVERAVDALEEILGGLL
ncbi:MAG: glycosyltransferase family 4 protein [Thermoanaerobaculia bacterium]|nr:glycosyltransferase family 4 protein [Thermoanaerobaculia bacterium]